MNIAQKPALQGNGTAAGEVAAVPHLGEEMGQMPLFPPVARIPRATYRLQLNRHFTFADARRLAPYLAELGISDIYASPYLKASDESTHGYDVADHTSLNPAIGSDAEYGAFIAELRRLGMGQILDIVPNHMGIAAAANRWWMDVLENGPSSPYARYFDITWESLKPELRNKVLLPILGDQYGVALERGELQLGYDEGAFFLHYYETVLPIAPGTYGHILQPCLGALGAELDPSDQRLLELQSIITAVGHLPARTETSAGRVAERQREKEIIKRRLATLVEETPEMASALEATLRLFNGVAGRPASFDRLDALLNDQAYRLAYWRVASEEINYRRFFDVNQLAAIRVEEPEVFQATHALILDLLGRGAVTGLRIDHPDGLWDPAAYLRELQRSYLQVRLALQREAGGDQESAEQAVAALERRLTGSGNDRGLPLYVVVEKILSGDEELRSDWATHGTTGYEFANMVTGLLVDAANRRAFDELYSRFIGRRLDYGDLVNSTKKMIMLVSLSSEINALSHRLNRISERHRRFRDFTLNSLTFAIREIIAALPVYRTYSTCEAPVAEADRRAVEHAVAEAKRRNPRTETSIFDFIRDLLLLNYPTGLDLGERADQCDFVMKFQQTTGPVMAKGAEDTAFYIFNRLVALNEVGGEPNHFGLSVAEFHRRNQERRRHWPHAMLNTSTHDTKRSEDVRARISVLSEIPREWGPALNRWSRLNARHKRRVSGQPAPDRNDEYLLYQVLLGTWPFQPLSPEGHQEYVERIQAYMEKATREAKVHTSWVNPNQDYDAAVRDFVRQILDENKSVNFLASFRPLQLKVAHFGVFNALTQVLLKLTCPGVPDIYQGNELWDFSLVDPDNRRPVDYALRQRLLRELRAEIAAREPDLSGLARELLETCEDGRVKLYVTHRVLDLRRRCQGLFAEGDYRPLSVAGARASNTVAFARKWHDDCAVIIAPRLTTRLVDHRELGLPLGAEAWGDAWLELPDNQAGQRYRDVFSGALLEPTEREGGLGLPLASIFEHFPLSLLERLRE